MRILTGLRANGELHLGSYLGSMLAMKQRQADMAQDDELYMFVADMHSFTTPIDHSTLQANIINNVRMYLAAGVDPSHNGTVLYRQSYISAHAELAWILSNFTYFGELSRMVEFKDKSERLGNKAVSAGLFNYPVLMAADILLYGPQYVPLGDDQKQHMELARTLGERFNNKFGDIFGLPEPWVKQVEFVERQESIRIMSLQNPSSKMSKSIDDPKGTILLLENPETAAKKIMSAETDSIGSISFNPEAQPGITNLLRIGALLAGQSQKEFNTQWDGQEQYGPLKTAVAELVKKFLVDFQELYAKTTEEQVRQILEKGEQTASDQAQATLTKVKQAVGLL